ncbi:MAG: hypothetical protein AAF216_00710 [Pseudomonadota bacterium]
MIRFALASLAVLGTAALPAAATLSAEQTVQKLVETVSEDGTVTSQLVTAEEVAPGDMVVYGLNYSNDGEESAEDVSLTMPVPVEVAYVEGSATSEGLKVSFSVDGGETFTSRGDLTVTLDGESRTALAEDITHIQWQFPEGIAGGSEGEITFAAVLN